MAVYASPQPLWKRNLAGILDFVLAALSFTALIYHFFHEHRVWSDGKGFRSVTDTLAPWAWLAVVVLVIGYFVLLGCTGGTVFQRLLQMRRIR